MQTEETIGSLLPLGFQQQQKNQHDKTKSRETHLDFQMKFLASQCL